MLPAHACAGMRWAIQLGDPASRITQNGGSSPVQSRNYVIAGYFVFKNILLLDSSKMAGMIFDPPF